MFIKKIFSLFVIALFSVSMWADCFIAGAFTDWETNKVAMTNVSGNYYVAKIQISSGIDEYNFTSFKVIDGDAWYGVNSTTFYESNLNSWKELSTAGANMALHVAESGTYFTFIYDQSSHYFAVIFPDTKIIAAGNYELFDTDWDEKDANNALTTTDNYTYTWTVDNKYLEAGQCKFKIVIDEDWNKAYPASDYEINIAEAGSYDVTITFNTLTMAVNATAVPQGETPTIKLHGNFTGVWVDTDEFEIDGNNETASLTLYDLQAGNYEFGVKKDGTWVSNGAEFTRNSASHEVVAGSDNLTIAVDQTGDYTFTWTYDSNLLTVTYPTPTALDNTADEAKAVKRIVNGQLVIEREGKLFNALGAEVK